MLPRLLAVITVAYLLVAPAAAAEPAGLPTITPMKQTGELGRPDNPDKFTFVVYGDNRPGQGEPQPETIHEIFAAISQMKDPRPGFALSLGDIIEGKDPQDSNEVIKKQFEDFLNLAAKAGVPMFNAPGNHEMDDDNDVPSERMHKLYQEVVGPSYGAFTYGNSRFICLNTENVPPPGTPAPEPPLEFSFIADEQLAELAADLEANRDKKHIFIAMHYPLHPKDPNDRLNPTDRKKLLELFAKHKNISFVLAAHEHLYYNAQDPENVTEGPTFNKGDETIYLVSGGAGAPLYVESKWHFFHYLVFEVDGDQVSVTIKRLKSSGAGK